MMLTDDGILQMLRAELVDAVGLDAVSRRDVSDHHRELRVALEDGDLSRASRRAALAGLTLLLADGLAPSEAVDALLASAGEALDGPPRERAALLADADAALDEARSNPRGGAVRFAHLAVTQR